MGKEEGKKSSPHDPSPSQNVTIGQLEGKTMKKMEMSRQET